MSLRHILSCGEQLLWTYHMRELADRADENKTVTFDDLFGGPSQAEGTAPEVKTKVGLGEDADLPSGADLTKPQASAAKILEPLEKLPAFHHLLSIASTKGYLSQQEVVAQLPEGCVEEFVHYAIDHDIVILETDPLAELAKEEPPPTEVEAEEELDLFHLYQYDAWRFPLLSAEDEVLLAKKIEQAEMARWRLKKGIDEPKARAQLKEQIREGEGARTRFIEGNLRLVIHWARRYLDHGLELMDVIQEGNLGLMKAVDKFDYRQGCRFSTYASWWIKQAIARGIAEQSRLIRLPMHIYETLRRFKIILEQLMNEQGREPTLAEIALKLGLLTEADTLAIEKARATRLQLAPALGKQLKQAASIVSELVSIAQEPLSLELLLDETTGSDGEYPGQPSSLKERVPVEEGSIYMPGLVASEATYDPLRIATHELLRQQLEEVLAALSPRQRWIIELRFGLRDGDERTLEEIGQKLGVTRERVRQIEAKALRTLRHPLRCRKLREYLGLQESGKPNER